MRKEAPEYGLLNDMNIRYLADNEEFIKPYHPNNVKEIKRIKGNEAYAYETTIGALSFGTSSFGYDFTLADELYVVQVDYTTELNVKAFNLKEHTQKLVVHEDEYGRFVVLPPHSFVLGHTVEYVKMPDDLLGICFDKSTYARIGGIQTNVTSIEPGWEGQITLEIRNTLPCFTRLYVNEGLIQTIFIRGIRPETTYADKKGKYQGQTRVTGARV
ncbi:dCTP deaminase [Cytobacillus kochii]|uniref:dCTP deaminase n=1 Tax=Cytobacillus kochii TaxID=859143 RepID=UPI00402A8B99